MVKRKRGFPRGRPSPLLGIPTPHYDSPFDGPPPRYTGPEWIGKQIKAPPYRVGPQWIGKPATIERRVSRGHIDHLPPSDSIGA